MWVWLVVRIIPYQIFTRRNFNFVLGVIPTSIINMKQSEFEIRLLRGSTFTLASDTCTELVTLLKTRQRSLLPPSADTLDILGQVVIRPGTFSLCSYEDKERITALQLAIQSIELLSKIKIFDVDQFKLIPKNSIGECFEKLGRIVEIATPGIKLLSSTEDAVEKFKILADNLVASSVESEVVDL